MFPVAYEQVFGRTSGNLENHIDVFYFLAGNRAFIAKLYIQCNYLLPIHNRGSLIAKNAR